MAKTPTNAPKATPPKMGAAAPKTPAAKPETPVDDAAGKAAAAAAGSATGTTAGTGTDRAAVARTETTGAHANTGSTDADQVVVDRQRVKDEESAVEAAYKEGYTNGFSAALDERSDNEARRDPDLQDGTAEYAGQFTTAGYDLDRADLISLALCTPENQRKGGLFHVVGRLADFVDGLAVEDRGAALQFMSVIARTSPMDLASGRFKTVTLEAIEALKGAGKVQPTEQENANASAAALDRLQSAAPDLDNKPENLLAEEGPDLPDGINVNDPDSSEAAARRLAGA